MSTLGGDISCYQMSEAQWHAWHYPGAVCVNMMLVSLIRV